MGFYWKDVFDYVIDKSTTKSKDEELKVAYSNTVTFAERYPNGVLFKWGEDSSADCIHWDFTINAPVSNFGKLGEVEIESGVWVTDVFQDPAFINIAINDNKAGPNGEHITWQEIIDLYHPKTGNTAPVGPQELTKAAKGVR